MNTSHYGPRSSWRNSKNNRGTSFFGVIFGLFIIAVIVAMVFAVFTFDVNFSNGAGTKVGQVVKLSRQGLFSKTWEGQIIRGGMNGGSGGFGTVPFDFTIQDAPTARKVQDAMDRQQEIKITYDIAGIYSRFTSESGGHFLTDIEVITNNVASIPAPPPLTGLR